MWQILAEIQKIGPWLSSFSSINLNFLSRSHCPLLSFVLNSNIGTIDLGNVQPFFIPKLFCRNNWLEKHAPFLTLLSHFDLATAVVISVTYFWTYYREFVWLAGKCNKKGMKIQLPVVCTDVWESKDQIKDQH